MIAIYVMQQCEIAVEPSSPSDAIAAVAFHEPADIIALGFESGSVSLLRKSTGSVFCILPRPATEHTPVRSAAISPDGKLVAIGGPHQTVEIWNLPPLTQRGRYYGHQCGIQRRPGMITALAWSPDSTHIASGSSDGSIHLWNAHSLQHLGTFVEREAHTTPLMPITALAWSPDEAFLADATNGMLRIWDRSGHLQHSITVSPQGTPITALSWVCDAPHDYCIPLFACDDGKLALCAVASSRYVMVNTGQSGIRTPRAISWSAWKQQGYLMDAERTASHLVLHLEQFSFV